MLKNDIGMEAANQLAAVLPQHKTLKTLCGFKPNQTEASFYDQGLKPADALLIAADLRVHGSLTDLNLSSNNLAGETGYVKATKVQGSSFNVGDKVVYEGREMVVSKGKDSDGDIKMIDVSGVKALADSLAVNGSLTKVLAISLESAIAILCFIVHSSIFALLVCHAA